MANACTHSLSHVCKQLHMRIFHGETSSECMKHMSESPVHHEFTCMQTNAAHAEGQPSLKSTHGPRWEAPGGGGGVGREDAAKKRPVAL